MSKVILCFIFYFIFPCINSTGQTIIDPATWKNIDSAIRVRKNLNDIQIQLLSIKTKAIAEHNDVALARCFADLLLIKDQKTEDSLYFKNAAFMDSILNSTFSSALLKSIMHLFLARRIYEFENRFYYERNKTLIRTENPDMEYAQMNKKKLDSLIAGHIDKSIEISKQLERLNLDELLWLSSDPLIFLFRPDYTDLLFGERIFMFRNLTGNHSSKYAGGWLSESQDEFIKNGDQIKSFNEDELRLFHYFYQWIQYHLASKPEAAYFIETLARKYLYQNLAEDSANKEQYEKYLNNLLVSPYNSVSGHAVYQLCKIWYSEASLYNPTLGRHITRYGSTLTAFDSSYRLNYIKTLQLLNRFETKLDSFPYIKYDLLDMRRTILKPGLNVMTLDVQTPDSAFPVLLQYKNISHLYTRVIRISSSEDIFLNNTDNIGRFLKMPVVAEKTQSLILPDDHQWHNSFVKMDPLTTGRYIILYSDTIFSKNIDRINFFELSVTNIAAINNDQRIFVLNRITGLPIKGATVLVTTKQENKAGSNTPSVLKAPTPRIVNDQGYVVIREKDVDRIDVYYGNDSITASVNKPEDNIPNELYDKDRDADLSNYYEKNIRLNIFTDRAIYRPGQTVFFKGIFTVPNLATGEIMILDFQKLPLPFFEKLASKTVLKYKKLKTDVTIRNPFSKTVDTFRVTPNQFGSFSGFYLIPKNAATGEWNFETEDYEMADQNSGAFHVEEYKRPSFKLILTKPKTELQLGDSFNIQVKVRSFAGAPLSRVRLRYRVSRYFLNLGIKEILSGETFSNELGESKLVVRDSSLHSADIPEDKNISAEYTVEVEALDETGESHEQELDINLSNRPVNINMPVPKIVERNSIAPFFISMTNEFYGTVKKPVEISIYKLTGGLKSDNEKLWPPPDLWIENQKEWQKKFPDVKYDGFSPRKPDQNLIYKTTLSAEADKKFMLPADLLASGDYKIVAVCHIEGKTMGEASREFSVYDAKGNSFPGKEFEWLAVNSAFIVDTLKFISGYKDKNYYSIYHFAYRIQRKNSVSTKYDYVIRMDKKGLNEMDYKIPAGIVGDLALTHLFIMDNRIYRHEYRVQILNKEKADPDIIIEKYRTQISPGEKETFMVSIKTKDPLEVAELMTTMYDAALDELEPHKWEIPRDHIYYNSVNNWNQDITEFLNSNLYEDDSDIRPYQKNARPLWWISSSDLLREYYFDQFNQSGNMDVEGSRILQGQVLGLSIQTYHLNNVVVAGYGVSRRELTGAVSTVRVRGINSLSEYKQPMIILDGVLYTGDINKIRPETITQGIILKGADAAALYGSRAADGVLILSTHGPIVLPVLPEAPLPPLLIRKNFAESAFFYPSIYADKKGMYTISFTLPESVTEWKWKLFAHTRKARFAYLEKSLFSQLPLMVQPSLPRFLYQGDKIIIKTRITNLDTTNVVGQLSCLIEDLVTGENLSTRFLNESSQTFSIKRESNSAGSFSLNIPPGFLHPLRIRISGATKTYSDGEEHIIPILSSKFLVSQTKFIKSDLAHPFQLATPSFPEDAEPYGLSLFISPKPQATLMNALTYLAFDPYGCSEQTLNKMLAFAMGIRIVDNDSMLRQDISKIHNVENAFANDKQDPGPDEQTMPWLQLRHADAIHQQKLRQLFDTVKSKQAFEQQLSELVAMQNTDGGLSWFKGGKTDEFISGYVLAGLGKMQQDGLLDPAIIKLNDAYSNFPKRLINYADGRILAADKWTDPINFLYARSYWVKIYPVSPSVRSVADSVLKLKQNNIGNDNLDKEATLIIIGLRFTGAGEPFHDLSIQQLESIRQLAISDPSNGVRWKAVSNSDDLDRNDEETVARIAEAFETAGTSKDIIKGIVKWILKTRNEHVWSTTKSTAAIVGLLQLSDLPGVTHQLSAKTEDSVLTVTDDLLSGRTTDFLDFSGKKFPPQFSISTLSSEVVTGGIKYYYFSSEPPDDSMNKTVNIHKSLSRYNNVTGTWEPIVDNTVLQIGDKIKTTLTVNTSKQLNYVFINESKAATMEPRETESGYKYEDGLGYYQSVKDAGYLFFVDKIPSGIHNISYETVITASGNFTNGPASLQCMYQPSINSYSNIGNVEVKP